MLNYCSGESLPAHIFCVCAVGFARSTGFRLLITFSQELFGESGKSH